MAGLTKTELAGKTAYLASSDPPPEVEWKELTQEEKDKWIKTANPPFKVDADSKVTQISEEEFESLKVDIAPSGVTHVPHMLEKPELWVLDPVSAPKEEIPPCPPMTIEQGDKTPAVLEWRAKYQAAK